jgi:ELWxxDGT repeat protein
MKYWKVTIVACLTLYLTACGGSSGTSGDDSNVIVEEISLTGITLSMSEGVLVGTLAEEQLQITNGPEDLSTITLALTDDDSEYFSVEIIAGATPGDYLGNLSLVESLLGLAGSDLNFTATVSAGGQSLSVPVVIHLTEIVKTLEAYEHQAVFNKSNSRIGTSESESGLVIATQPQHGTVEAYFVGNEMWDFDYTSTDCFAGQDSYLYQIAGEYGEVSVNVTAALHDLTINAETNTAKIIDLSAELPSNFTQTITITQPEQGTSSYNSATKELTYTPNSSATSDSFTYAANGCAKTISVTVSRPPLLLALNTTETGQELWKSDGTVAGTVLVKDINLGADSSSPGPFLKRLSDGMFLFFASQDGERGIWKTSGTEESTVKVKDILASYGSARNLTLVGDDVYFTTKTIDTLRLWKSDGTEDGTVIVKELPILGGDRSGYLHTVNGKLLFNYDHPHTASNPRGEEAWVSDGTALGTAELKDIWPGGGESDFMKGSVIEFKGNLYSRADDGSTSGSEVWMTDGTTNGTKLLADLEVGSNGSIPTNFTAADDVFYFTAVTSDKGDQLWKSDGTSENTVPVKDMDPNSSVRDQDLFSSDFFYGEIKQGNDTNGLLFFAAKNGDYGIELWKSDGTDSGTVMVKDLMAGVNYSSRPGDFVELNNTLYFTAYDLDNSRNLWQSDGTEEGTFMVKSFASDELESGSIEVKNGIILLNVRKGGGEEAFDYQLWRSDGTETGTYFLGDIL